MLQGAHCFIVHIYVTEENCMIKQFRQTAHLTSLEKLGMIDLMKDPVIVNSTIKFSKALGAIN